VNRVCVIGCSGAGKSTLSNRLGQSLQIPVAHLDRLFWRAGWVESPRDEFEQRVREAASGDRWIIDGTFISTQHLIMPRADTIVWFDFPRSTCLWRVARRWFEHRGGRTRTDMTEGCPEKIDFEFLEFIWTFNEDYRPRIVKRLEQLRSDQRLVILRTPEAVARFLNVVIQTEAKDLAANLRAQSRLDPSLRSG
jgi:adenylate kinase family enzyme